MIDMLHAAIDLLPNLLQDRGRWKSLHVVYEPPRVERLWTQHEGIRILLHRIWPPDEDQHVLYHPHPWRSATRIVRGRYMHKIGTSNTILSSQMLVEGCEYTMTYHETWHSVRPVGGPSDSIMVLGDLYAHPEHAPIVPSGQQPELSASRVAELLDEWRDHLVPIVLMERTAEKNLGL